jgi:L-fuconolactonase
MRIDAHQHFWKYDAAEYDWIDEPLAALRRNFLPEDLRPELEGNGFNRCVAVQARQSARETRWLLELAENSPFIAGVVGWVDLQSAGLREQLQGLAGNSKLVGVRHVVQSEPDERFLMRPEFLRGVEMLEEFGLAYDILIYPKHLQVAAEFVSRFPRQRFVLDHLAKPDIRRGKMDGWKQGIQELAAFPNVYCKLSGMVTEADWNNWTAEQIAPYLAVTFACFGAQRLMIGSDWPVCLVAGKYAQVMDLVKDYLGQLPAEEREGVLGRNAHEFWRLEP